MIASMFQGRLGNHLFVYSNLRALGEEKGIPYAFLDVKNPEDPYDQREWLGSKMFDIKIPYSYSRDFYMTYWDKCNYHSLDIGTNDFQTIQDETLIRGIFQGKDAIDRINPNWFPVIPIDVPNYNLDTTCIIHFRGTDTTQAIYWPTPPFLTEAKEYYVEAKQRMSEIVDKKLNYIVITDDIPLAKQYIDADEYLCLDQHRDFWIMHTAKYLIIINSTFSWWASFLSKNNEVCIAPSGWFHYKKNQLLKTNWCYTDKFIWI